MGARILSSPVFTANKDYKNIFIGGNFVGLGMRKIRIILFFIMLNLFQNPFIVKGQNVYIPDTIFKNYLLNNSNINDNGDDEIQVSEATSYSGAISVNSLGITDLTGIESFTLIYQLSCKYNQLTNLDVSANVYLTKLFCNDNQIVSLDVSSNTHLSEFFCYSNQLSTLDISSNNSLYRFSCANNHLTTLDFSNNPGLDVAECTGNQLTNITGMEGLTSLKKFYCRENLLSMLDFSGSPNLVTLYCDNNQLTYLNVSSNSYLEDFTCGYNQLDSLDVSTNSMLDRLMCHHNQLKTLNLKNGNNTHLANFACTYNPDLFCIEVDNENWSNTNWIPPGFNKDNSAYYSESCIIGIKDKYLIAEVNLYPNPATTTLTLTTEQTLKNAELKIINAIGQEVYHSTPDSYRDDIHHSTFDISQFPQGLYYLTLKSAEGTATKKFEVIR
jgi:hypothetical protein